LPPHFLQEPNRFEVLPAFLPLPPQRLQNVSGQIFSEMT